MSPEIDYVEESGPGIPELPAGPLPGELESEPIPVEVYPGWEEKTIEQFLKGGGVGLHMLIGQTERDWLMTEKDLERIAPPLTRIANRYEPALRLSPLADPLLVAHGFVLYAWRSELERRRALRNAEEELERSAGYERVERTEGAPAADEPANAEMPDDSELAFPESPRATQP